MYAEEDIYMLLACCGGTNATRATPGSRWMTAGSGNIKLGRVLNIWPLGTGIKCYSRS